MNRKRQKFKNVHIFLIVLVVVIVVALIIYTLKNEKKISGIESVVKDVAVEVQQVVYSPFKGVSTFINDFVKLGGTVLITELPKGPLNMLKRSGLYDDIGSEYFFDNTTEAVNYALDLVNINKCSRCSSKDATSCQVYKKITNDTP